jgi:hypothetical protein
MSQNALQGTPGIIRFFKGSALTAARPARFQEHDGRLAFRCRRSGGRKFAQQAGFAIGRVRPHAFGASSHVPKFCSKSSHVRVLRS